MCEVRYLSKYSSVLNFHCRFYEFCTYDDYGETADKNVTEALNFAVLNDIKTTEIVQCVVTTQRRQIDFK